MASYDKTALKEIFKSSFSTETWQELLINLFHANRLRVTPQPISDPEDNLQGFFLGSIDTPDGYSIGLFRYDVTDGSVTNRRVGLRNLVKKFINVAYGEFDAALVVYDDSENWRLSFICDIKDAATTPKRYSYVFGDPTMQYHTPAERFLLLQTSGIDFCNLREAFSVDALSKQFFDEYRELYADFVQYITGRRYVKEKGKWVEKKQAEENELFAKTFASDDKLARDYIKKMFGRIVFLYFLQRKGWLAGNKNYMHDLFAYSDKKDDFLDGVLEPLFFDLLNTKPELRPSSSKNLPGSDDIPYLNGGLFEKDEIDPERCIFPASYFERLFGFLDSYNFTIDENDAEDAEIGIDPEMLGRIFENLLEDNKDKGAFYTPKEIVDFMCRESLIAYLNNGYEKKAHPLIRKFIETIDPDILTPEQRMKLLRKLVEVKICDPAIGSGAFPMGLVNLLSRIFIALKPDADRTLIKRHIMEKSIYGVDIEKGAVDIARLRFWLAMVVDEKEPKPLPNLHFKIMQGNSLIETFAGVDLKTLIDCNNTGDIFWNAEMAKQLRMQLQEFYNADDHGKRNRLISDIRNTVITQLVGLGIQESELIGLDPSETDEFFLWHTWFADVFENGGFDIVIGNPPYIQLQGNGGSLAKLYDGCKFESFARTGDIYCLFYEQGWRMLKNGGHLCFITSNKWMRAGYGKDLRRFLANKTNPKLLLDFGGIQVFDSATVDTNILLFSKDGNRHETQAVSGSKQHKYILKNLSDFVRQNAVATDFAGSDSWVILSPIEQSIKRKIESVGVPLKDWDINIYRGVLTGYNEAFIISTEKRDEILSNCQTPEERQRTEELIRPILRGRDIKRYGYDWSGLWLIATFPAKNYDIEQYPAVKNHLLSFAEPMLREVGLDWVADGYLADYCYQKLAQTGQFIEIAGQRIRLGSGDEKARKKTSNKWFETQDSISYWDDFNKPQIVWLELTDLPKFSLVKDMASLNTVFFMTGEHLSHIIGFLNSAIITWYFHNCLGARSGAGTNRWLKYTIEQLPIPPICDKVSNLVDNKNITTKFESSEIDEACMDSFALNEEEKAVIRSFSVK